MAWVSWPLSDNTPLINPSTHETEAGGSLWIPGQPECYTQKRCLGGKKKKPTSQPKKVQLWDKELLLKCKTRTYLHIHLRKYKYSHQESPWWWWGNTLGISCGDSDLLLTCGGLSVVEKLENEGNDSKGSPLWASSILNTALTRLRCPGEPLRPKSAQMCSDQSVSVFKTQLSPLEPVGLVNTIRSQNDWHGNFHAMSSWFILALNLMWKICPQIWLLSGIHPTVSETRPGHKRCYWLFYLHRLH